MMARRPGGAERPPSHFDDPTPRWNRNPAARTRRGSLLVELAMSMVMLGIAMSLTVKVMGWVAHERRSSERRERAVTEVANLMERITAHPFDEVTPDLAGRMTLSTAAGQTLPDADLKVEVIPNEPGAGRSARRIGIQLRWKNQTGQWDAPVRLTSWIERRRPA